MLLRRWILPLLLLFSLQATAYEKVGQKKLFNGDTLYEYGLENGLRVFLVPRHQAKVLTYQTWFRVGSLNEKLDPKLKKTGLAHLFEHMMFRGSEKYPDGKFDELTSRMGGEKQNATTYFYRTNYFESVPSDQLEAIMELESDRMSSLKLTAEILEKEKGAVVGELRRANDNPMRMAWDEIMKLVFTVAPYRFTVLGTEAEIKGFTRDEAQYFYKTYYAPNNATIIVVGDTTGSKLMPLIEKYYGKMKSQTIPPLNIPEEPAMKAQRRFSGTHPQATSELMVLAYRIPGLLSPDVIPLVLLSTHLAKGMEARLRKALVDTGIAVSVAAAVSSTPDIFEIFVSLAEGKHADEALKIIDKEIENTKKQEMDGPSFERAINQEKLGLYHEFGQNASLASSLGESLMICGNPTRELEILDGLGKLSPKDVQAAAQKYFDSKNRSIVVVKPARRAR